MLITNNDRLRLNPHFAPVFAQPAKTARAAFFRSEDGRRFGCGGLFVIGVKKREPEVWRRQPFFRAVAKHRFNVTADEVDALIARVRFAPCFPYHARHMLDDVFHATTMKRELRSEFPLFRSCSATL